MQRATQHDGRFGAEAQHKFLGFRENGCRYFNILGPYGERPECCQIL